MQIAERNSAFHAGQPVLLWVCEDGDDAGSAADTWGPWIAGICVAVWASGLLLGFLFALKLLTLLGFVAAVLGLRWPFVGLVGVGVICVLDPLTRVYIMEGGLLRWNTLNYWLLFVTILNAGRLYRLSSVHSFLLGAFLLLVLCESLEPSNLKSGAYGALCIGAYYGLLAYFLRVGRDAAAWYWLALIVGLVTAFGGLLFYWSRDALPTIDTNALSYFPVTALVTCCLALEAAEHRNRQWLLGLFAGVNFCWAFLTGSRGGLLVACLCLLYLLWQMRRLGDRLMYAAAAAIVALAVLAQFPDVRDKAAARVQKLFDSDRSLASRTHGRSRLAKNAWRTFVEHPFGVGTGEFPSYWDGMESEMAPGSPRRKPVSAHSAWMKTLAENGFPGTLLLLAFVCSFAAVGWLRGTGAMRALGIFTTMFLGVAFLSQEFVVKGTWFLTAAATMFLQTDLPEPEESIELADP
jgi:O-antigen ligase